MLATKKKKKKKRQTNNKKLLMNHITCKLICNIMGLQYCGSCKRNFSWGNGFVTPNDLRIGFVETWEGHKKLGEVCHPLRIYSPTIGFHSTIFHHLVLVVTIQKEKRKSHYNLMVFSIEFVIKILHLTKHMG